MAASLDTVFLHGIKIDLAVGIDAWHRENKVQPVILNLNLVPLENLEAAANEDDVSRTLDYGKLYKRLLSILTGQSYASIQHLFLSVQQSLPAVRSSSIELVFPKAILLADEGLSITRKTLLGEDIGPAVHQRLEIRKIRCSCIIGVNAHERLERQRLVVNISSESICTPLSTGILAGVSLEASANPSYIDVVKDVFERVENSAYQTVEALATAIAQIVTINYGFDNVTVRIDKPSAISAIEAAGVQVTRTKAFFENKDFWKVKRP